MCAQRVHAASDAQPTIRQVVFGDDSGNIYLWRWGKEHNGMVERKVITHSLGSLIAPRPLFLMAVA